MAGDWLASLADDVLAQYDRVKADEGSLCPETAGRRTIDEYITKIQKNGTYDWHG